MRTKRQSAPSRERTIAKLLNPELWLLQKQQESALGFSFKIPFQMYQTVYSLKLLVKKLWFTTLWNPKKRSI